MPCHIVDVIFEGTVMFFCRPLLWLLLLHMVSFSLALSTKFLL
uniref:Uncharacterized protein n=1 Tax=Rhizophora mucronata TaxID=61149 RepID=A0A2P2KKD6_RHIMU